MCDLLASFRSGTFHRCSLRQQVNSVPIPPPSVLLFFMLSSFFSCASMLLFCSGLLQNTSEFGRHSMRPNRQPLWSVFVDSCLLQSHSVASFGQGIDALSYVIYDTEIALGWTCHQARQAFRNDLRELMKRHSDVFQKVLISPFIHTLLDSWTMISFQTRLLHSLMTSITML